MVAYSIGSYCAQIPVGERKSGMPLSVEIPAPLRTTAGPRSRNSSASRATSGTAPESEDPADSEGHGDEGERAVHEPPVPLEERPRVPRQLKRGVRPFRPEAPDRSEEHTSELQ